MQESSAAGYQLRRHYQKYLLSLECLETGQNAEELVAFAEKQKKKKKEKEHPSGTPSTSATGGASGKQQHGSSSLATPGGIPPPNFTVPSQGKKISNY